MADKPLFPKSTSESSIATSRNTLFWSLCAAWIFVFVVGTNVPSAPFRAAIRGNLAQIATDMRKDQTEKTKKNGESAPFVMTLGQAQAFENAITDQYRYFIRNALVVVFSWMWTNVFLLSIFASAIGELGRTDTLIHEHQLAYRLQKAFARGVFIYFVVLAGQLIYVGNLEMAQKPADVNLYQYFKIAGVISLAAFLAGYSPGFFGKMVDALENRLLVDLRTEGGDQSSSNDDRHA